MVKYVRAAYMDSAIIYIRALIKLGQADYARFAARDLVRDCR